MARNKSRIAKRRRSTRKRRAQRGGAADVTVVSAYYPLSSKHSFEEYMEWGKSFLCIESPIVLFTTQDMAGKIKEMRGDRPIQIIVAPFEDLYMWKQYKQNWIEETSRDPDKKQGINHTPELYALWANKWIWVEEAIQKNPFSTSHFLWCDFGCFRNGTETDAVYKNFPLSVRLPPGKVLVLLIKTYGNDEYRQFKTNFKAHETKSVIGGGIWGGDKAACIQFRNSYETMLKRHFDAKKWAGQDQKIMSAVFLEEPDLAYCIQPYTLNVPGYDEWFFLKYYLSDLSIQTKEYSIKDSAGFI